MTLIFNKRFRMLLKEFGLPENLSFEVDIPREVQEILEDEILVTDLGVALKRTSKLYKATDQWENRSIKEDSENHFHVDWYVSPITDKGAFMLGIRTIILLAGKFEEKGISGIRFWYNFETPELSKQFALEHKLHTDGDDYYISDRLSFYTRRAGEEIITVNPDKESFNAILVIDI